MTPRWPFNLIQEHPVVYCQKTIVLAPLSETYCMRPQGHAGACSIYLDTPKVVAPPARVTSTPLTPFIVKAGT